MDNEVLEFIKRRFQKDCDWINGNCFWFAHILTTRFPYLQIYYMPIRGHFVAGHWGIFYDYNGIVKPKEVIYSLEEIRSSDTAWYERIVRDCIK